MICLANGAYGREATLQDWHAGKDFQILCGPYFSIRDISALAEEYSSIDFLGADGFVVFTVEL